MSIDLRAELNTLLNEDLEQDNVIIRHFSEPRCQCVKQQPMVYSESLKSQTPSAAYRNVPNPYCNNCEGSGWTFFESITTCKYFYTPAMVAHNQDYYYGGTFSNIMTIYLPITDRTRELTVNDLIFQMDSHEDGRLKDPIVRLRKWIVTDKYDMHLDGNKLEFFKLYTKPAVV